MHMLMYIHDIACMWKSEDNSCEVCEECVCVYTHMDMIAVACV